MTSRAGENTGTDGTSDVFSVTRQGEEEEVNNLLVPGAGYSRLDIIHPQVMDLYLCFEAT